MPWMQKNNFVRYISTKIEKLGSCFILEWFYSFPIAPLLSLLRISAFSLLNLNLPLQRLMINFNTSVPLIVIQILELNQTKWKRIELRQLGSSPSTTNRQLSDLGKAFNFADTIQNTRYFKGKNSIIFGNSKILFWDLK